MKKNVIMRSATLALVILIPGIIFFVLKKTTSSPRVIETKQAEDVFSNWVAWQQVVDPENIALDENNIFSNLTQNWGTLNIPRLKTWYPDFLTTLAGSQEPRIHLDLNLFKTNASPHLKDIFELTQNNIPGLIQKLHELSFASGVSVDHEDFQHELSAYLSLSAFMYGQADNGEDNPIMFSVANQFLRNLIEPSTFPIFSNMFSKEEYHPIIKLFYSTIWHNLVGIGWKTWSSGCIDELKKAAQEGKKLVYLAGGSDVYQLINNGIYNIVVIDPQLPTQADYYAQDWSWFMKGARRDGGIGDKIIFKEKNLIMTRTSYEEKNTPFSAHIAEKVNGTPVEGGEKTITINPSKTTWTIADKEGKTLGTCIIDRRFVNQEDFKTSDKQTLLISFNEMFFISVPDKLDGWHIDPNLFPDNISLIVKQLHEPVTKPMLCNLRKISMLNHETIQFISLGSCSI